MNIKAVIIALLVLCGGCQHESKRPEEIGHLAITIRQDVPGQVIHNFGASDAWSMQFVGKNWPINKREQIADWLFSRALDRDGNPVGIGLSAWRFNIGAGSAAQGEASGIPDEWRRAETFYNGPGLINDQAHAGQRWFLKAAQERGTNTFTGFSNSPPTAITKNGLAFSSGGSWSNLKEDQQADYVNFLADVIEFLQNEDGVTLDYISPFNEPQWNWDNSGQEGSPWQNSEIAEVARSLNSVLVNRGLSTLIEIPEAGQLDFLTGEKSNSGRDNQIEAFFSESSPNYLGDLDNIAQKVAGHSYYTTWDFSNMVSIRKQLRQDVQLIPALEFWMTEYCVLEDNSIIQGNGRDLGMETALYTARVIYTDLVVAGASSWNWWLAVSPYDYKDGLIYIDHNTLDGAVYDSKTLWALGHFSRFIPVGSILLNVSRSDLRDVEQTLNGLMAVAFQHPDQEGYTVVAINATEQEIPLKLDLPGQKPQWEIFRTTAAKNENMKRVGISVDEEIINVPAKSITTWYCDSI